MKTVVRAVLIVTVLSAFAALGLSIWPGALEDMLLTAMLYSVVGIPLALCGLAGVAVVLYRRHWKGLDALSTREAFAIPVVAVVTLLLVVLQIPRHVAFLLARSSFEQMVQSAPMFEYNRRPLNYEGPRRNIKLGLYEVDWYVRDPRGGVFFRTHLGPDGLGPDQMSYGFAYQPNREATPFGSARYNVHRMVGEWYSFCVSNDY